MTSYTQGRVFTQPCDQIVRQTIKMPPLNSSKPFFVNIRQLTFHHTPAGHQETHTQEYDRKRLHLDAHELSSKVVHGEELSINN